MIRFALIQEYTFLLGMELRSGRPRSCLSMALPRTIVRFMNHIRRHFLQIMKICRRRLIFVSRLILMAKLGV